MDLKSIKRLGLDHNIVDITTSFETDILTSTPLLVMEVIIKYFRFDNILFLIQDY